MRERPPGISDVDAASVRRGYESRDVPIRPLLWLSAGFLVVVIALAGGLWWFYSAELSRTPGSVARRSVVSPTTLPADAPPLQPQVGHESLDAWDLRAMRDRENATFSAMGWTPDDRTKRVTVPAAIIEAVRRRQAASRPVEGGR